MKIIVAADVQKSCEAAAEIIRQVVQEKPNAKLGLATGGTPVPIYQKLIEWYKEGAIDFSKVHTINLDEYCGLGPDHPQSYRYFMNENLFNHINIDKNNTYVVPGLGDAAANAAELEAKIYEGGTPDLQLLGIGTNGHVGFNEAGSFLQGKSHMENLVPSTIEANARFFETRDEVPTQAVSMGMKGILSAKSILLVATGPSKKEAIQGILSNDEITTQNPATFLKLHPDVTIVIDQELANLVGYTAK